MRPLPRLTLRTRATLLATALTGLTLLIGSVALVLTLDARLTSAADDLARSRVQDLLALSAAGGPSGTLRNVTDDGVAQIVTQSGEVLAASPNIAGRPAISDLDPGSALVVRTVDAPDDAETETYRLWAGAENGPDGRVIVYVGSSLESVDEATGTLRRSLALGAPVVLLLLAGATWLVLGGALRRIDRIRTDVDEITEDRLDRRVPEPDVDDEVGRLAVTMNRMLERLETAQRKQRAFVADVSHDLQSPLAAQRTQLEVALAHPETSDLRDLAPVLLSTTAEMERLVRDLLFLASADAGGPAGSRAEPATPIDLEDVVLEEAARARTAAGVRIDTSRVSAAPALANRDEVARILRNLLDNALAHAESVIELSASLQDGTAVVSVVDDGPGVDLEERELIFDRFHRGDRARSRHTGGSGLGLAIARTLAERNGGDLELVGSGTSDSRGAHFRIRLPGAVG